MDTAQPSPHSAGSRAAQGLLAERFVAEQLQQQGWTLLEHDWRTPYAQVDLFFRHPKGFLVLVEVKARSGAPWLQDEDVLSHAQRLRLQRTLCWVAALQQARGLMVRLDLALVELFQGRPTQWRLLKELELV